MKNNDAQKALKRFIISVKLSRLFCLLTIFFYGILLIIPKNITGNICSIIFCPILLVLLRIWLKNSIFLKSIVIVKYPHEYEQRINFKKKSAKLTTLDRISLELYKGNIQQSVYLSLQILNDKNIKYYPDIKYNTFINLALCYFLAEDFDRLSEVIAVMSSKAHDTKKILKLKAVFNEISLFYTNYIDGDYDNCKAVCKTVLSKIKNNQHPRYNLYTYLLAVSHYKLGEYDEARPLFEKVIEFSPNIIFTQNSKKYIESMDNDTEYQPAVLEKIDLSTLETDVVTSFKKEVSKMKKKSILIIIPVLVLSLIIGIVIAECTYHEDIEYVRNEYSEYYEGGTIIANVTSEKYCYDFVVHDDYSFSVIRIKYKDGKFNRSSILPYQKYSPIYNIIELSEDSVLNGGDWLYEIPLENLGIIILGADIQIPDDVLETYDFEIDGEPFVLCVKPIDVSDDSMDKAE
ncbi:MAG: tetratricopeptide repeat protein [Clostridia bacterium]|nr:tetratricopeptide repeat protein [Clostridia bacterium]